MMIQSEHFLFGDDIPVEDIGGGLSRQIMGYNEELMAVKVFFEKGAEGYVHKHRHSQVSYVEKGTFEVNVDGKIKTLTAGDCFFVPPNVDHGAVCTTGGILIDVFSPMREDFVGE
ncbi:cupin domain-containing protein [Echinimonas agarilytica]|uniref:Cupin domain-containing protein n=1 Tax=Echinimonas agarilytica TaxID=1215918 RepID=A0AA42B6I1_9GAMM|nr:cupin domain-containing protein [Echinimonas agarilytica]MCM2678563.1 cupin domain-containing protein [Echinimonas agarilytica]